MTKPRYVRVTFSRHKSLLGPYYVHQPCELGWYIVSRMGLIIGRRDGYTTFGEAITACEKHHHSLEGATP